MITSFIAGIAAALTPCTVVLIPIFLYRFGITVDSSQLTAEDRNIKLRWITAKKFLGLVQVVAGFLLSLIIIGLLFDQIASSEFFNVLRLVLGTTFIIIGVLQLAGQFNFTSIKRIANPFLLGLILPWVLSFSPCVIPIFSALISSQLSNGEIYLKLLAFGVGLLTPAILTALLGTKLFEFMKKASRSLVVIEKLSGVIIIVSGIYLNFQVLQLRSLDIVISGLIFAVLILLATYYSIFIRQHVKISNVLIFTSVLLLWGIFTFNCYNETSHTKDVENEIHSSDTATCIAGEEKCEACTRCAVLYSLSASIGATGYVIANKKTDKTLIKIPKIRVTL